MARPTGIAEESPALRTATAGNKPPGRGMRIVNWHDDRLGLAKIGKENLRKVFPDTGPSSWARSPCTPSLFCCSRVYS
ncbi:ubiquinol-cytochrome c reductase [Cutibacterium acnes JCM 18916]|nr:ubiquinol-cytochrome c reductase [Cutibacterium acnes JCM 18916]